LQALDNDLKRTHLTAAIESYSLFDILHTKPEAGFPP